MAENGVAIANEEHQLTVRNELADSVKSQWLQLSQVQKADQQRIIDGADESTLAAAADHLRELNKIIAAATLPASPINNSNGDTQKASTAETAASYPARVGRTFIEQLFPPPDSPFVNYGKLNSPLTIANHLYTLPLGHTQAGSYVQCFYTFLGVFTSITVVLVLHEYYTLNKSWPIAFASLGALVTITFTTPGNPVIQPYHMFMGTAISALFAVIIQSNLPGSNTNNLWLAGALSAATSITLMQIFGCVHPPGGAISLLYILVPSIQVLGYWYILAAEVGNIIVFLVACIINNLPAIKAKAYPASYIGSVE